MLVAWNEARSGGTLVVNVEIRASMVAYTPFVSSLCQTLEHICKAKGEFTSQQSSSGRDTGPFSDDTVAKWMPPRMSGGFKLAVATLVSADSSRVTWNYYVLDEALGKIVCASRRVNRHANLALLTPIASPWLSITLSRTTTIFWATAKSKCGVRIPAHAFCTSYMWCVQTEICFLLRPSEAILKNRSHA